MLTSAKMVLANFLKNGWKSNFGPAIFEKFKIFPIFYTKFEIFGGVEQLGKYDVKLAEKFAQTITCLRRIGDFRSAV